MTSLDLSFEHLENQVKIPASILLIFMFILAEVEDSPFEFADAGGFQTTLDVMCRWKDSCRIQGLAFGVLSEIRSSQKQVKAAVLEAGGIELTLDAMKLFLRATVKIDQQHAQSHKDFVITLGILSSDNFDAVIAIQRAGGLSIMVEILQEAFPNASFADKICLHLALTSVLFDFARLSTKQSTDCASTFLSEMIDCGVVSAVLQSMDLFSNDAHIQYMGCGILAILASDTDKGATSVAIDGGRMIIERAKAQHMDDANIQECAHELLESIEGVEDMDRCHRCHATSDDLMQCGRCKKVLYCSRDCQREGYKLHKKICKQMAKRPSVGN